jgi:patatin-like phospholipase/acyl hydrolase
VIDRADQPLPPSRPFQILSFDGGGLKGLFAAALLAEIEDQLHLTIADHFDLIAGTSTGGLIALAMGAGISPAQIVDFYVTHGPTIFGRPHRINRLWHPKHDPGGLRAALTEVFGDRPLSSSVKRLVIPAYSLDLNDVYIFKTRHHARLTRDHAALMVDVAMATTAAPTFLPASPLGHRRLVDGGVWANNPTLVAVAEARSMLGIALDDMAVLSVGTTDEVTDLPSSLDHGGLYQWAARGRPMFLRAQATGSFHTAEHLVGQTRVVRVDAPVAAGIFRLDRLDASRIRGLAEARAGHECPRIKPFTGHIAAPFVPIP